MGKKLMIISLTLVAFFCFFLGFFSSSIISEPIITGNSIINSIMFENPSGFSNDKPSPSDTIKTNNIRVFENNVQLSLKDDYGNDWLVVMDLKNPVLTRFRNTNSMDPVLDSGANAIRIKTKCPETINVGDIISYKSNNGLIIVHRVVKKGFDDEGAYFILKGDNNPVIDPWKVRCNQYLGKLVAIIY